MSSKKILIADADDVYRHHLRDFLIKKEGFAVFDVGNGETAVNIAIQKKPSLVVLNLDLPDMSGIEVCRKLKSDDQLKSIPVIIYTPRIVLKELLSAFVAGAQEYLAKPSDMDDIYFSLRKTLLQYDDKSNETATEMNRMRLL